MGGRSSSREPRSTNSGVITYFESRLPGEDPLGLIAW